MSTSMEVGTSSRGRRSWPESLKREIVAASLKPGASVSVVARRYDVNANQVFSWRRLYHDVVNVPAAPQLVPVMVKPDAPTEACQGARESVIEIHLGGRYRVRVDNAVDVRTLRRVLDLLERR